MIYKERRGEWEKRRVGEGESGRVGVLSFLPFSLSPSLPFFNAKETTRMIDDKNEYAKKARRFLFNAICELEKT